MSYSIPIEVLVERPYLNIQVSDYLQKDSTEEDRRAGIDIADVLIRWYSMLGNEESPEDENPIAKEIQRCFSPQYYDEVMALVEDLDLEIVRITRRM